MLHSDWHFILPAHNDIAPASTPTTKYCNVIDKLHCEINLVFISVPSKEILVSRSAAVKDRVSIHQTVPCIMILRTDFFRQSGWSFSMPGIKNKKTNPGMSRWFPAWLFDNFSSKSTAKYIFNYTYSFHKCFSLLIIMVWTDAHLEDVSLRL